MRTVWINGEWVHETEARISVFDRGLLFSQSVYEVAPIIDGRLPTWPRNQARLGNSLRMASIEDATDWLPVLTELVRRNGVDEGLVYVQVTGGSGGDRSFLTSAPLPATRIAYAHAMPLIDDPRAERGLRMVLRPDLRWQMRTAKTTQLLYSVLMKQEARAAGVDDALLVEGGVITEGTSMNVHILDARGIFVSHPVDRGVLPGTTRIPILEIVAEMGLAIEERPFTPQELFDAREVLVSAAGTLVLPVVEVDGRKIGDGRPGPFAKAVRAAHIARMRAE
jgi:D-alanine transaminase